MGGMGPMGAGGMPMGGMGMGGMGAGAVPYGGYGGNHGGAHGRNGGTFRTALRTGPFEPGPWAKDRPPPSSMGHPGSAGGMGRGGYPGGYAGSAALSSVLRRVVVLGFSSAASRSSIVATTWRSSSTSCRSATSVSPAIPASTGCCSPMALMLTQVPGSPPFAQAQPSGAPGSCSAHSWNGSYSGY